MKTKLKTYLSLMLFFTLLVATSCQTDALLDGNDFEGSTIQFTLSSDYGSDNQSKSITKTSTIKDLNVRFFLVDSKGIFVDNRFVVYDKEQQTINIEAINRGGYELFVLAYSPQLENEGFTVASTISQKSDRWMQFTGDKLGLITDRRILFGKISFEVGDDPQVSSSNILLSNVLSAISVDFKTPSEYVRNSINSVVISSEGHSLSNSLSVDGALSGTVPFVMENVEALEVGAILTLPSADKDSISFNIMTKTINHEATAFVSSFDGNAMLGRGEASVIKVNLLDHPDSNNGLIFVSSKFYNSETRPKILQDTESKSIYYDHSQRWFRINEPLQVVCTSDNKLHTRFYSPVPISAVKIWAKVPGITDEVLIAFLDTIHAFSDAQYEFTLKEGQVFKTKSNQYVALSRDKIANFKDATLSIESYDSFWEKIKDIRAKWLIQFNSYGGDPDAANGSPTGSWMGIRPVHIREAIAFWLNMAYLITMPAYATELATYQGRLYGNGGPANIIDVSTIIPGLNNLSGFDVGLVYTGHGVAGLGGGRVWGVAQDAYRFHYLYYDWSNVPIHELGHCLGYNHTSSMTYGLWAGGLTDRFYVNNIRLLPVNSSAYLNTNNNPYLYK